MNLKTLRKAHKLTQVELAYRMGVNVQAVKQWEGGQNGIASRHHVRLARILEVGIEDIWMMNAEIKLLDAKEIT